MGITSNEIFKSLEKFSARTVNLVLYFFVLELLPIKIIMKNERIEDQKRILQRQKYFSRAIMIIALTDGVLLSVQRMYDYIEVQGEDD